MHINTSLLGREKHLKSLPLFQFEVIRMTTPTQNQTALQNRQIKSIIEGYRESYIIFIMLVTMVNYSQISLPKAYTILTTIYCVLRLEKLVFFIKIYRKQCCWSRDVVLVLRTLRTLITIKTVIQVLTPSP